MDRKSFCSSNLRARPLNTPHSVTAGERLKVDAHRSMIPLSSMPRTVADAIVVCRKLRLQYLWVDRLCIIQDDASEWLRECGQMS